MSIKKHLIYKKDKWNMLTVEVHGRSLIVREISQEWGEESHIFVSRPAMMEWVHRRFRLEDFQDQEEYQQILQAFQEV